MYDETVLMQQADSLKSQASSVIFQVVVTWALMTLLISFVVLALIRLTTHLDIPIGIASIIVTAIAALAGVAEGKRRSFLLRLEAQKIYVLLEIEHRTRPAVAK